MNSTFLKLLATALLLSGFAIPQAISAAPPRVVASESSTSTAPAAQREAIASAARRTLRYITQARSAIHDKDLDQARQDLLHASEMLALLEATRPATGLKEHIWIARQHMDYETAQEVIDDLTLIDAELLRLADIMPTARAQQHLQNARASLMQNDTETARQELDRLGASLTFTEFDLPLAACKQQILAAQEALARNQPASADKNLVAAEESIQFITLGGSGPLVSARTHLSRATKNYHDEYFAAARADLTQASEWLRRAGKDADEKSRKEAQVLAAEVDALRDQLDAKAEDHAHTLAGLLHRSAVLLEREAEDLWLRYKLQEVENRILRKLLDAKTHLYYVEHDLIKGRNTGTIRKELQSTNRYLEQALSLSEPPVRERIEHLRKQVQALEQDLGGDRGQLETRYQQARAELIQLISDQ